MVPGFCITYIKVVLAYPGAVAALFALHEGAKATGFNIEHPTLFARFAAFTNAFFALLVDHWLLWLLLSALIAMWWTWIVVEPKAESKRKFDGRRRNSNPRSKG